MASKESRRRTSYPERMSEEKEETVDREGNVVPRTKSPFAPPPAPNRHSARLAEATNPTSSQTPKRQASVSPARAAAKKRAPPAPEEDKKPAAVATLASEQEASGPEIRRTSNRRAKVPAKPRPIPTFTCLGDIAKHFGRDFNAPRRPIGSLGKGSLVFNVEIAAPSPQVASLASNASPATAQVPPVAPVPPVAAPAPAIEPNQEVPNALVPQNVEQPDIPIPIAPPSPREEARKVLLDELNGFGVNRFTSQTFGEDFHDLEGLLEKIYAVEPQPWLQEVWSEKGPLYGRLDVRLKSFRYRATSIALVRCCIGYSKFRRVYRLPNILTNEDNVAEVITKLKVLAKNKTSKYRQEAEKNAIFLDRCITYVEQHVIPPDAHITDLRKHPVGSSRKTLDEKPRKDDIGVPLISLAYLYELGEQNINESHFHISRSKNIYEFSLVYDLLLEKHAEYSSNFVPLKDCYLTEQQKVDQYSANDGKRFYELEVERHDSPLLG